MRNCGRVLQQLAVIISVLVWSVSGYSSEKYKILALLPYHGKSHFYFAEPLLEELAQRGHNVTVVSRFPRITPLDNYNDIVISTRHKDAIHDASMEEITEVLPIVQMMKLFKKGVDRTCREALAHPNVQRLIRSDEEYDLIITEAFNTDCFLGFVAKFNVPHVALRTSSLSTWFIGRTGNPDNPAYIPATTSGLPSRMNFFQRLWNAFYNVIIKVMYRFFNLICEDVAKEHFGQDMPDLQEIATNTTFYLVNTHFVHQFARPLLPNVKEVAGLHLRDVEPLDEDLENWISGADRGLIYLNLGSVLKPSSMSEEKRQAFFEAFTELEDYRVLMKWDRESVDSIIDEIPDNVRLISWSPQNDILHHWNVRLFITHGGMLGSIEALHAGVPMLVIPFFGDQPTNAALLEERGLGIAIDYSSIGTELLVYTMKQLLENPMYLIRAKKLSAAFKDRPMEPRDEAVWWIEYLARHKGVAQDLLRSPALDLAFHEQLLLDVVGFVVLLSTLLWWGVCCKLGGLCRRSNKDKED